MLLRDAALDHRSQRRYLVEPRPAPSPAEESKGAGQVPVGFIS
ncbi:hypothetical protein [Pseudarthrobacter sp. C4D7]|nr:hypothetical protein [Pseudarthrobacter sp. C4D7]